MEINNKLLQKVRGLIFKGGIILSEYGIRTSKLSHLKKRLLIIVQISLTKQWPFLSVTKPVLPATCACS